MADSQLLVEVGAQIWFGENGAFSPAVPGTDWSVAAGQVDVNLRLGSDTALIDGAARQSDKVDLGAERAPEYELLGCVDFTDESPVAGQTIDYYWAPSPNTTQANGNIAGNSGADAAVPAGAVGGITKDEFLKQCDFIGSLVVHDGGSVQNGWVGVLRPTNRYGQLIVVNNSGGTFEGDDVEMHQVLNPIVPDAQG